MSVQEPGPQHHEDGVCRGEDAGYSCRRDRPGEPNVLQASGGDLAGEPVVVEAFTHDVEDHAGRGERLHGGNQGVDALGESNGPDVDRG